MVRKRKECKNVELRPYFRPQRKRVYVINPETGKKERESDRFPRETISKGNTGAFYVELYAAMFGGKVCPRFKGKHDVLTNGELTNHNPDIIAVTKDGEIHTEIKSISTRDSRYWIEYHQQQNYFKGLCERLLDYSETGPDFRMGLFRYGTRNKHAFLFGSSTEKLVQKLCEQTRDLAIIPANLAMFSLLLSKEAIIDKDASKSEIGTWHPRYPCWFATQINGQDPRKFFCSFADSGYKKYFQDREGHAKSPDFVKVFSEEERRKIVFEDFMLDRLRVRKYSSDEIVEASCNGTRIKPFRISEIYMSDKDRIRWLEKFKERHEYFLVKLLGLRDLYGEKGDFSYNPSAVSSGEIPEDEVPF